MDHRPGHAAVPIAALLCLLAAALFAACGSPAPTIPMTSTTGPTIGPLTAAPATPLPATEVPSAAAPSAAAGAPACTAADLKVSHGLVEGAAGSRITEVVLVAAASCAIDAFPTFGLRDANGTALVGGVAAGTGRMDLEPGGVYNTVVRLANWCTPEPAFPVTLELRLGPEELTVTGGSFPEGDSMPPCLGDATPILAAEPWTEVP